MKLNTLITLFCVLKKEMVYGVNAEDVDIVFHGFIILGVNPMPAEIIVFKNEYNVEHVVAGDLILFSCDNPDFIDGKFILSGDTKIVKPQGIDENTKLIFSLCAQQLNI